MELDVTALYESIFKRKSIRKFKHDDSLVSFVSEVKNFIDDVIPLNDEQIFIQVLDNSQVTGRTSDGAYYVAFYTDLGLNSYTNLGFLLEQFNLWITSRGYGAWAHGLISPIDEYSTLEGLPFAFLLTFGRADEELYRNDISEFDRKSIDKITDVSGIDNLLEAVRLGPSGRNRQPWFFTGDKNKLILYKQNENFIFKKIAPDVHYIDGGIALLHLWISAKYHGFDISFEKEGNISDKKGFEYIYTIKLDEK